MLFNNIPALEIVKDLILSPIIGHLCNKLNKNDYKEYKSYLNIQSDEDIIFFKFLIIMFIIIALVIVFVIYMVLYYH